MRTLIISMTCGEGHNQIAKAIKRELDDRNEESKIIQLYGYSEKEISRQNKAFQLLTMKLKNVRTISYNK